MGAASRAVAAAVVLLSLVAASAVGSEAALNCGACKGLFDELNYKISKVDPRKRIDVRSFRIDPDGGKRKQTSVPYARSETHLTELFETVCDEMENYSNFVENGKTIYKRYQKRPGDEGTLNLTNFGWSVDVQKELRLACDAILAEIEDDVMSYYQGEKDLHVPAATKFCPRWCEDRGSDEL